MEETENTNIVFRYAGGIINTVSNCLPKVTLVIDEEKQMLVVSKLLMCRLFIVGLTSRLIEKSSEWY